MSALRYRNIPGHFAKDISLEICKSYDLGNFKQNKIILVGYEDFNFALETSKGKYLVKVFEYKGDKI